MADLPRLNGVIRAWEEGKPAFTSFSQAEIENAVAMSTSKFDGIIFEMEHNFWDARALRDSMQYMLNRRALVQGGTLAPTVTPMVRIPPNGGENNQWHQVRRFTAHPTARPPSYGLEFRAPSSSNEPWRITTQWSERELIALLQAIRPSREELENLFYYADSFVRTRPASNPLRGTNIPGRTHQEMFRAPFVTAPPIPNGLAPSTTNPPTAPETAEPNTPADENESKSPTPGRAKKPSP